MSQATKEEKSKGKEALAVRKPLDLMSRFERDMERMFDEFWRRPFANFWGPDRWRPGRAVSLQTPAVDVYEEKDDVVVKAEVPGLSKDDLDVNLTGSTLTIKGNKGREEKVNEEDYFYSERSYGSFSRSIELPTEIKGDQVKASFKDGILEIRLPKTEEAKKKTMRVKID